MAGIESLSFCGPMLPFQPPPPIADVPIPIGVMRRSLFPKQEVSMYLLWSAESLTKVQKTESAPDELAAAATRKLAGAEVPARGEANCTCSVPFSIDTHSVELNSCSCPALSSSSCWLAERDFGDPISFHAVNALLWLESTKKCSSNPRLDCAGRPLTVRSMGAAAAGRSSS